MGVEGMSNAELLARIAASWLRDRVDSTLAAQVPHALRELLDEAVRRAGSDRAAMNVIASDTPTETPASRRRQTTPPRA
jgi:hypothetical protein